MSDIRADSEATVRLLERAAEGDAQALGQLHDQQRPALKAFVQARLGPDLRARFDASDVVQEAWKEVVLRIRDYLQRRPMPFHLWVRRTTYQRLVTMRRDQDRDRRTPRREMALPERSSLLLAGQVLAKTPSPSEAAEAKELAERISRAVGELSEDDREILLLRHAEELPYGEIAALLGIEAAAARKRYGRALIRLQEVLTAAGLLE